jgi:uncharacterized protein (TIGR00299 family) protein
MILGALVDCGLPVKSLRRALKSVIVSGWDIECLRERRGVIEGTRVRVILDSTSRDAITITDMVKMIARSKLDPKVKEASSSVLGRLAQAEAKVHRTTLDTVHLDELGTLDTLIDVVGACFGFSVLGLDNLYASPFPSGSGLIKTAHGVLPVPSPATMELIAMANAPITPSAPEVKGETVTPTGAAILTTMATFERPTIHVSHIGYGLGTRDMPTVPNALALWVGTQTLLPEGSVSLLQTNIDDMNPQLIGYVQEKLLLLGALDVWVAPIQMKKGRPGVLLSLLASPSHEALLAETILRETTTLGIRVSHIDRYEAIREIVPFHSSLGVVPVKIKRLGLQAVNITPEYEACRGLALEFHMPLQEVLRIVSREAEDALLQPEIQGSILDGDKQPIQTIEATSQSASEL